MIKQIIFWLAMIDYRYGFHKTYNSWASMWGYELEDDDREMPNLQVEFTPDGRFRKMLKVFKGFRRK